MDSPELENHERNREPNAEGDKDRESIVWVVFDKFLELVDGERDRDPIANALKISRFMELIGDAAFLFTCLF